MHQLKLFRLLITPSYVSGFTTFAAAAIYLAYISWADVSNNPVFYASVYGPHGISTFAWDERGSILQWFATFFSSSAGYYVILFGCALVVGAITYAILDIIAFTVSGTTHYLHDAEVAGRPARLLEVFVRLWLRALAIIGLVLLISVAVTLIAPWLQSLIDNGINLIRNNDPNGYLSFIEAFAALIILFHGYVIFARLCFLRPRIFGRIDPNAIT